MNSRSYFLLWAVLLLVAACAVSPRLFDGQKHGILVGSVRTENPDEVNIWQLQLLIRKKKALLSDAINLYFGPDENPVFHAIVLQGDYELTSIRVHSGGQRYVPVDMPLPIGFSVQPNATTNIGQLVIGITGEEGLLGGRIFTQRLTLATEPGNADSYRAHLQRAYPDLPTLRMRDVQLLAQPVRIDMQPHRQNEEGLRFADF